MEERLIQITSGRGPAECCLAVAKLLKKLLAEADDNGFNSKVISREIGIEKNTLFSAIVKVEGELLEEFCRSWEGSVLWTCQSPYREFHKRKNWYVAVNIYKIPEEINVDENEITFKTTRSSGPGGQHVNKVSTAVRASYPKMGLSVLASDSRSQSINKKTAKERILNLIKEKQMKELQKQIQQSWQNHNQLERGNPIRTYKGLKFIEINRAVP